MRRRSILLTAGFGLSALGLAALLTRERSWNLAESPAPGVDVSFELQDRIAAIPTAAPSPGTAPTPTRTTVSLGGGFASYYSAALQGNRTASGRTYRPHELTAAHRSLPFGRQVRVVNKRNGKSTVVTITDRGPFTRGRVIDVSRRAAEELGFLRQGIAKVELFTVE